MANTEIDKYIEGARAASDRGRFVVLVIITGSILTFSAFWNSRQGSWVSQRLHLAKVALQLCPTSDSSGLRVSLDSGEPQFDDRGKIAVLPVEDRRLVPLANNFYEKRHYHSCDNLRAAVRSFEKISSEDIGFIHVPFFGFGFDINDLGMLSGIAFVVMLMWLRLSLESELRCVRVAFTHAKELDMTSHHGTNSVKYPSLTEAYRLLGMYQVFTRVSMTASAGKPSDRRNATVARRAVWWFSYALAWIVLGAFLAIDIWRSLRNHRLDWSLSAIPIDFVVVFIVGYFLRDAKPDPPPHFWQRLSLGLFCLPVLVLLLVFRNDMATLDFGLSVSHNGTLWLMTMEGVLILAASQLTLDCIRAARSTDAEWKDAYDAIMPRPQEANA